MSNSITRIPQMTWVNPDRLDDRMDAKPFQVAILSRLDATDSCGFPVVRLGSPRATEFLNRGVGGAVEQPTAVRLFKTRHVRSGYLEMETAFLPESKIPRLGPKLLKKGDVLLTSTGLGTIGRAALFMGEEKATVDNHVTIIRTTAHINRGYLTAFLNSTYGSAWTDWGTTGSTGQLELAREKVSEIRLPCPDRRIQDYIGAKVELAERCRAEAANTYNQALKRFDILLDSRHFHPRIGLTNKIDISRLTQRLNGEFYLPRYFDLEEHLASLSIRIDIIGNLVRVPIIRTSTPKRDEEAPIPCILTSDIDPQQINSHQPSLRITPDVHEFHAGKLESYDVVYTSVGPPVGEAAVVLPQHLPMAVGGDVSVIRTTKDLHPGFLCLYLNSVYGQMQNDRYSRGIRQRRVYPEDIGSFLIPIPKRSDQEYIGDRIIKYELFNEVALGLVAEAKSDIEALIEGTLDTNAILSGKLKPPTRETINESLGSGTDE